MQISNKNFEQMKLGYLEKLLFQHLNKFKECWLDNSSEQSVVAFFSHPSYTAMIFQFEFYFPIGWLS